MVEQILENCGISFFWVHTVLDDFGWIEIFVFVRCNHWG